uniref:Putative secreted protein n=1 Tax=Anopheles darlingi TaxID=43151 RepID=A0A2M4DGQ2_ANODA
MVWDPCLPLVSYLPVPLLQSPMISLLLLSPRAIHALPVGLGCIPIFWQGELQLGSFQQGMTPLVHA